MIIKNYAIKSVATLFTIAVAGCVSSQNDTPKQAKAEVQGTSRLELADPIVRQDAERTTVTGTIHRTDWAPLTERGHVHVIVLTNNRTVVQTVAAKFGPPLGTHSVRTPGPRTARYTAHLAAPLPEAGLVRVEVAFDTHSPSEMQE